LFPSESISKQLFWIRDWWHLSVCNRPVKKSSLKKWTNPSLYKLENMQHPIHHYSCINLRPWSIWTSLVTACIDLIWLIRKEVFVFIFFNNRINYLLFWSLGLCFTKKLKYSCEIIKKIDIIRQLHWVLMENMTNN
jgi:hypothetical protein